jgi:membrane protein DedA with SNARE-associated domain
MLDELLHWIERTDGPLPYLALAAGGASEYVIPVLPGDTVTLFGASLCSAGGKHPLLVYGAINAGSIGGAMLAYAFGRWLAGRPHAFTKHRRTRKAIFVIQRRFARHGPMYLVVNRFLPALRAFFFVAAGMIRMPVWQVLLYGGVSALLWNALILGLALLLGNNFEALKRIFERYTTATFIVLGVVALVFLVRWAWQRPRPATDPG